MSLFNTIVLTIRRMAKALYLSALFLTGGLRWARSRAAELGVVVVTLHRVLPDEKYDSAQVQPGMAFCASTYARFLEYIIRNCECVLPGEVTLHPGKETGRRRPRLVLTFDDGWQDNYETAFPISQKLGIPFTIFICPQMMTTRNGFWTTKVARLWTAAHEAGRLDVIRTVYGPPAIQSADLLIQNLKHVSAKERETLILKMETALALNPGKSKAAYEEELLTWPEVKQMQAAGIVFGSHTNTHAILTKISSSEATRELIESKRAIEAELSACPWFAYPNGDWSSQVRQMVEQSGYQAAFINSPGIWQETTDQFSIPRVNLWEGSLMGFRGRFSRLALEYAVFWKAWRASGN